MSGLAFSAYLIFTISWFLHLGTRIPFLGAMRFDLLLAALIAGVIVLSGDAVVGEPSPEERRVRRALLLLVVFAVVAIPFARWPGSAIKTGIPQLVKATVFYYFTTRLVTSRSRLRQLLVVFIACQTFRVLEPAYLHLTTGYWGSFASMGYDRMDRLSGAPSDVVNPNGLAFVILTVIPFFHYLGPRSKAGGLAYWITLPILLYALVLTGSRSGMLALGVVLGFIWLKSRRKVLLAVVLAIGCTAAVSYMSDDLTDRYLSIVKDDTRNSRTADGRLAGELDSFAVAAHRPIFGHGLGTSPEANFHYTGSALPSHILFGEIAEELGFVGVVIFLFFMKAIFSSTFASLRELRRMAAPDDLLNRLALGLSVWLWMNAFFSLASYGLSSYEWYFAAGLSEVLRRSVRTAAAEAPTAAVPAISTSTGRTLTIRRPAPRRALALTGAGTETHS